MPDQSAVGNARLALANFYNVAIGIANVAARFTVFVLWLRDEFCSPTSPQLIARLNIGDADIHEAVDQIGIGRDAQRYSRLVGSRTTPDVDDEPRVRDPDVARRALAVAFAQNMASEDRFVEPRRSFDVGDGEKMRHGKSILWRHLIAFLRDLYLVHRRLHSEYGVSIASDSCGRPCTVGRWHEAQGAAMPSDASTGAGTPRSII